MPDLKQRYTEEELAAMREHYHKGAEYVQEHHIPRKTILQIQNKAYYMRLKIDKEVISKRMAEQSAKGRLKRLENRGLKPLGDDPVAQKAIRDHYPNEGQKVLERPELQGFNRNQLMVFNKNNGIRYLKKSRTGTEYKPRKVDVIPIKETTDDLKGRALPYWGVIT